MRPHYQFQSAHGLTSKKRHTAAHQFPLMMFPAVETGPAKGLFSSLQNCLQAGKIRPV